MKIQKCSRCRKNVAVVYITKIENDQQVSEGLCLKCARELGIKPVSELMEKMGITDSDVENMSGELASMFGENGEMDLDALMEGMDAQPEAAEPEENNDDMGKTATLPFVNRFYGGANVPQKPIGESFAERSAERKRAAKHKFLDAHCISLSRKAAEGKIDRIVGRESEIARVIQILNRRQKNNPCLIGEPGVGKTAVAEGLALRIAEGNVPYKLRDKEVHLLDLTSLVAGTQFRGQFESRMKGLIEEVRSLGNIILVIDEVHNLVGAGDAEGSMNAANILKPALSRGEIQVIGATTFAEYRKSIEKDTALERRFQPVVINEPSVNETVEILRGIKNYYEDFHGCIIPDEICRQAVLLSERYITDRFLPDKAIDLIDEACSDINLRNKNLIRQSQIEQELAQVEAEREAAASTEDYEKVAQIRSRELQLRGELEVLAQDPLPVAGMEELAKVIELWTGIPASRIQVQEFERLSRLEERLKEHIVGQDHAIEAVAAAIRRNRVGISAKAKPVSFIFAGPTGVGKTELVRRLAADMFDTPESLIRLDMSEFMEKHAVSRLIGAPPGYVGYDEAGQLTEKVRRRPYCVILFDEIEKAHPDVLNILLQILDDGRVTDAHGRVVNFSNTIIIMTTNAGSDRTDAAVGFGRTVTQAAHEKALKALSDIMRPEFINRIDEIIAFNSLSRENFRAIADIQLSRLRDALAEKGISLTWNAAFADYITDKSFSVKYGARNLQRLVQKEVEDVLASRIIASYEKPVTAVELSAENGQSVVTVINA